MIFPQPGSAAQANTTYVNATSSDTASGTALLNAVAAVAALHVAPPVFVSYSSATTGGTLADSTVYHYLVTSTNAAGESRPWIEQNCTTGSSAGTNTISLVWTPATGASGYKVYRGTSKGSEALIATVSGGSSTGYTDTGSAASGAFPTVDTTYSGQQTIQLGPGIFALGTTQLFLPDGTNLIGSGAQRVETPQVRNAVVTGTLITSTYTSSITLGCDLVPGTGSVLKDFAFEGNLTTNTTSYPIGCNINAGDPCADNVTMINVVVNDWSDGLYFRVQGSVTPPATTWTAINCQFNSAFDNVAISGGNGHPYAMTLNLRNCDGNAIENSAHLNQARCILISTDGATVNIDGGVYYASSSTSSGFDAGVIENDGISTGSTVNVNGARIIAVTNTSVQSAFWCKNGGIINVGPGTTWTGNAFVVASAGIINGAAFKSVVGYGRLSAQNAAATLCTFTVGGSDSSYRVSANVLPTTATNHTFGVILTYTDEGNTSRSQTLGFVLVAGGSIVTSIANTNGAVPYNGLDINIRAKASTGITLATAGTFTTVTYNAEGSITQAA